MPYSNQENLIIQSTCNAVLLLTLSKESEIFIDSDFFKRIDFPFPKIKEMYEKGQIKVGNQGMLLACLYSLLVLPKELILDAYKDDYKAVNAWIDDNKEETDTYPAGRYPSDLKHIYHLRNSISHGNVEFDDTNQENVICIFKDNDNSGHNYSLKLSTANVGILASELLKAQEKYMDNLATSNRE
ncbi:HEPN family nuclease [Marseilla massiliensis]|uniref:pEK499-p136 HEPN domain-containing protein n=1 Tax=Marseilla massiliensis TaxID=1841864 RepID=A0A938WSP5_9BACT|nr:HEPN family nuclease [Marseilla massiliensis]MBM6673383.1 hypothetical protein [Marseilla massiliensis]